LKRKIIVEITILFHSDIDLSDKEIAKIVKDNPPHIEISQAGEIAPGKRGLCSLISMKKHQKINIVPIKE
jgi:hypothetical protein